MERSAIVINVLITLVVYYIFYFREFILARKELKCLRCGNCCRLRVRLSEEDIEKITKAGYKDFLDKNGKNLKRINGYCNFLELNNGMTSCKIEKLKPEICKKFPIGKGFFGKKIDIRCRTCAWKLY